MSNLQSPRIDSTACAVGDARFARNGCALRTDDMRRARDTRRLRAGQSDRRGTGGEIPRAVHRFVHASPCSDSLQVTLGAILPAGLPAPIHPALNSSPVTRTRLIVLTLGPPLLIAGAYALSYSSMHRPSDARSVALASGATRFAFAKSGEQQALDEMCRVAAAHLRERLPADYAIAVCAPFVLAGDVPVENLERMCRETVQPVTDALWRGYFDRRPDEPVIIVALSGESAYRRVAARLDGYQPSAYSGYTQRGERRIVYNMSTGGGTLAHELSHVLASFDFPALPEWFDEGLAALHEEAGFTPDGLSLTGKANWRCRLLASAARRGELPALQQIVGAQAFRGEGEGLNYAYVRGLCLYLQERGMLAHFYRKFRANVERDPSGLATLCELLDAKTPAALERDFRDWAVSRDTRLPSPQ